MTARFLFTSFALISFASGCGIADAFSESLHQDRSTMVRFAVTHHGTAQAGVFPNNGDPNGPRTFTTDEDWTVTLEEAFVVTKSVALVGCDGRVHSIDAYWGALPESLNGADLDPTSFGDVDAAQGSYCAVEVTYGPWGGDAAAEHVLPDDPAELQGMTTCGKGWAVRGEDLVTFSLRAADEVRIRLDFDAPLDVRGDEPFPKQITLSKTYDRMFDAIDFTTATSEDLAANVVAVLQLETQVSLGARVDPT